jgi:hypothetical protein
MNRGEERKRDKRLPAPISELEISRTPQGHEAAPFYTEDLVSYDNQELHGPSHPIEPRNSSQHHSVTDPLWESAVSVHKELADLKEKSSVLDSELKNTKIKLNLLEKDYEKLQEDLNCAQSERKNFVFELEIQRLVQENDIKTKQCELIERSLKLERIKYNQDLEDIRNQLKQFKTLYKPDSPTNPDNSYEIQRLVSENQSLKNKILALEQENQDLVDNHSEQMKEQFIYFQEQLDKIKNQEEYKTEEEEEEDNAEYPKHSYIISELDHQGYEHYYHNKDANPSELHRELHTDPEPSSDLQVHAQNEPENVSDEFSDEYGESNLPEPLQEEPDQRFHQYEDEIPQENNIETHEKPLKSLVNLEDRRAAEENKNEGLSSLFKFDEVPETYDTSLFKSTYPINSADQIANLFDKNPEPLAFEENSPKNWFGDNLAFNTYPYTAPQEDQETAIDFFNSIGEQNTEKFGTVPRSLFD